ncbi:dihydroorotase [Sphingomonas solaris]|uniref:Amidohydrolase family protein n=1 Tax=Alterirhizorhabdus solaris TaxID=2529389 RepID=A0A558QW73_9SPHN|nr:amidohydrolase family protein [Sphingomonas solaris]TVV71317.1 amidohydrolase family protein [Sphingomonas solaris]
MTAPLAILNGRIVDPVAGTLHAGGLLVEDRRIVSTGLVDMPAGIETIDARGALIAPGLVDLGSFAIDLPAFAAGGITRAALMPDQSLPLDEAALVQRAAAAGKPDVWVHPIAAATRGLAGLELAEIGLMKAAGACAVATGRRWIADSGVMHRLLAYASALDMLVIAHAEDDGLAAGAVATAGETATRLGLSAAPAAAEAMAVARDLMLAEETGARLHFRQLTTARAFDLVRAARAKGVRVTCGISPAHLMLSDIAIGGFRTFARLSPPLRDESDRLAAIAAVRDGTIDILCSAHDPQGPEAKRLPYTDAEPGMAGAETLLALSLTLVRDGVIDLPRLFALLSTNPARLLGIPGGGLGVGDEADIILVDEDAPWRISTDRMAAVAGNTPFDGLPVQGKVRRTIKGGRPLG